MLDTNTKLLLHCDGDNNSTSILDSSPSDHICTPVGSAKIVTTPSKFGAASWNRGSLSLNGTTDYVSMPDSADWYMGSGIFTVESWINVTLPGANTDFALIRQQEDASNLWEIFIGQEPGGTPHIGLLNMVGGSQTILFSRTCNIINGQWHHIAVIRGWGGNPNDFAVCLDGQIQGAVYTNTNEISSFTGDMNIGYYHNTDVYYNGYIDELRISKGVARWISNFTPYCGLIEGKAYGHSPTPCSGMKHLGATRPSVYIAPALYFNSTTHTVNGLSAYAISGTSSGSSTNISASNYHRWEYTDPVNAWETNDITLYLLHEDGSTTLIATRVATTNCDAQGDGIVRWTTETGYYTIGVSCVSTDALKIVVTNDSYAEGSSIATATFVTTQLGATHLDGNLAMTYRNGGYLWPLYIGVLDLYLTSYFQFGNGISALNNLQITR